MLIKSILSGISYADTLEVPFGGQLLLERPLLNKGTAFTREERRVFGLLGLLPPAQETLNEQAFRAYEAIQANAVRLNLPIVHLVVRDGGYNLVGLLAARNYGRELGTGSTDFVALAESLRATGFRVTEASDLRPTPARAWPWCSRCGRAEVD